MDNPYSSWKSEHIASASYLRKEFERDCPKSVGFDTETTGLHIIKDKPFLIQYGWWGKVFTFYPSLDLCVEMFRQFRLVKYVFGHNVMYDAHMMTNIGYGKQVEATNNFCDVQAIMRLALEARSARDGGDNLKLKHLGATYIHPYANNSEHLIKEDLEKVRKARTKVLAAALKQFPIEGEKTATGRQKYWGSGAIEKFLKDPTHELNDLPEGVREIWQDWQEEYPEPTYEDVNRDIMIKYGGEDVITTLMLAKKGLRTLVSRNQMVMLKLENECLLPKYRMERQGLLVDREYLEASRKRMKKFIMQNRKELYDVAGEIVNCNQHDRIKKIYSRKWDIELEGSDKNVMGQIQASFDGAPKRMAELINTLRTAEKWYSTYILRMQESSSYNGRAYTQINLNGAVSGRMSSDFQQFPKNGFCDKDDEPYRDSDTGEEIFNPRKAFLADGLMAYIDYDQIELVTQSHYCVTLGAKGVNLPRAYMPYKCHHYLTGEIYKFRTHKDRWRCDEKQPNGDSVWLDESGKPWVKTDMHSLTAHKAFPHVPMDSPEFKKVYRKKGKTTNFACNYGAGAGAIQGQLNCSYEEAETLVNGYKEAFPEVAYYQQKIVEAHSQKGYVHNRYGRRYYLTDSSDAYKLANYVVQGSCADALKNAIIKLDHYLLDKESSMIMPIHDEVVFWIAKGEEHIIPDLLEIMQGVFDWCLIPVTAGVEITTTNWSEKHEEEAA